MNERIKDVNPEVYKLWLQAADTISPLKTGGDWQKDFVNKFAELIVRECAEVGLDSVEDGDDLDAIMKRVHNNILKHFGVKE